MADRIIGQRVRRIDAESKVTGEALYPGDLSMEGMLHMKILFSERAHARICSIDTSAAEAHPGVVAILTARDVPKNEYGLIRFDQPVLCGPGSEKPGADIVRTTMDQVALIAAETEEAAAAARDLIRVEYEDLPAVFDPFEAMQEDAPQLHADTPGNILTHYHIRKGDMEAGWQAADVVIEGTYTTSWQEHVYLQPEAGLAYLDDERRITVEVAGQWTHEDQAQICHALGLPPEQVRVIYPAIGGAFGGREDMSVQIVLALAVWKLRRPVKITWSREESIRGHHKRHPMTIKAKWGATCEGKITAAEVSIVSDAGAYAYTSSKVLGNATLSCTGPYVVPNAQVDARTVYTNNLPSGAFRGFGGPQGAFAAEGQINKLADALGLDPVELRLRNVLHDGDLMTVGTSPPAGVSIAQVVRECARHSGWQRAEGSWRFDTAYTQPLASSKRRGIGFAAAFKNIGFSFGVAEQSSATVELHGGSEIDEMVLHYAGAEVGQGIHTVLVQMVAEAAGVPMNHVRLILSDTLATEDSGSASASRLTFMAGHAVRGAVEEALKVWNNEERPAIGAYTYHAPATSMFDPQTGHCEPNFAYGYVAEAVEVEVDLETGRIDVLQVVCANDVGHAMNPQMVEGQIEGGIVQAQGYAIMEDFRMRAGHVMTPYFSNYLIPTVLDVPRNVKPVILEYADPRGPWGARGMGEMPFLPFAPAVAAALHEATGIWFDNLPITPERVVRQLRAVGLGGE
ncbi:MAG: molybdopterin-dependent oxidoreductase [Anaerolineae bacterium]|nr:molybdopterin-dependent oxidoreductase [Anaerolineae bacterium]